jgi:PKD repeat protein
VDKYYNFTITNLSVIKPTGFSYIIGRASFDIDNYVSWTSGGNTNYRFGDTDDAGKKPYLTITYTTGGGGAAPVAAFTCTKNFLRIPNSVTCTDSSTNTPTSWSWNMGDGSSAKTTQNVTYPYMKRGIWGITLNATNAVGSNVTPSATNVRVIGYENNW